MSLLPCFLPNGKWGYINETGQWMIDPVFDYAASFVEYAVASVHCEDGKWSLVDVCGRLQFEPRPCRHLTVISCERALVDGDETIVIDRQGREIWRPDCDALDSAGSGLFIEWFDSWERGRLVKEGGIPVVDGEFRELSVYAERGLLFARGENGYVLMDFKSNVLRRYPGKCESIDSFDDMGRAVFSADGLQGVITEAGNVVLPPTFKEIDFCFGRNRLLVSCRDGGEGDFCIYDVHGRRFIGGVFEYAAPAEGVDGFWGFQGGAWSLYRHDGRCLAHDVCADLLCTVDERYQGCVTAEDEMFYCGISEAGLTKIHPEQK